MDINPLAGDGFFTVADGLVLDDEIARWVAVGDGDRRSF
jgi:hypothetical protein